MAENVKRKSGLFVKETKFHVNRYCNDKTSIDLNASASNKKLNLDILPSKYKEFLKKNSFDRYTFLDIDILVHFLIENLACKLY